MGDEDLKPGEMFFDIIPESRNRDVMWNFFWFCNNNPELRFWQALSAWSGYAVLVADSAELADGEGAIYDWRDPFNWEGKDG